MSRRVCRASGCRERTATPSDEWCREHGWQHAVYRIATERRWVARVFAWGERS